MKGLGLIRSQTTHVMFADWTTAAPFAQQANFLDPKLTSDGKPYGPVRLKEIVKERYLISKHCHTSYSDLSEVTPLERKYLLEFITDELKKQKEMIDAQKAKRRNMR